MRHLPLITLILGFASGFMTSLFFGLGSLNPIPLFAVLSAFADIGIIFTGLLGMTGIAKVVPRYFPTSRIGIALKKWSEEASEDGT